MMFYAFYFNKVPSKAFGIAWMIVDLILCKNRNICSHSRNFLNSLERDFDLKFLHMIYIKNSWVVVIIWNCWRHGSMLNYRSSQPVLFLTDSALHA